MIHETDHSHDTTPSTPTLGGPPSWIKWVIAAGVLVLLFLAFSENENTVQNSQNETNQLPSVQTGVILNLTVTKGNWEKVDVPPGYRVLTYTGDKNLPFLYKDECHENNPIEVGGGQTHNIQDCQTIYLSTNEVSDVIAYKFVNY